jgi:Ni/Co efflux regulator RcnB
MKMNIQRLLLTAVAAAVFSTTGAGMAMARPHDGGGPGHHDRDRGGDRHDGWRHDGRGGHDRYWREGYRHGYVDRDRVFFGLRQHHYSRFIGDPFWFNDRYVVRTYDRFGHIVMVEVDPYTGDVIGVLRF